MRVVSNNPVGLLCLQYTQLPSASTPQSTGSYTMYFSSFTTLLIFAYAAIASSGSLIKARDDTVASKLAAMRDFIATIDPSEVTYLGNSKIAFEGLQALEPDTVTVVYCSTVSSNLCGGPCTVYTGGPTCIAAPGTKCLSSTENVAFCDRGGCGGSCNNYASCGTHLQGAFCDTPGTASILVPNGD